MVKIKVSLKDLEKKDTCDEVLKKLRNDPENAYTITGLMIEIFGVKEKDVHNKPFGQWPKGTPSLYTTIRRCLEKLEKNDYLKSAKHGRATVYYYKPQGSRIYEGRKTTPYLQI